MTMTSSYTKLTKLSVDYRICCLLLYAKTEKYAKNDVSDVGHSLQVLTDINYRQHRPTVRLVIDMTRRPRLTYTMQCKIT